MKRTLLILTLVAGMFAAPANAALTPEQVKAAQDLGTNSVIPLVEMARQGATQQELQVRAMELFEQGAREAGLAPLTNDETEFTGLATQTFIEKAAQVQRERRAQNNVLEWVVGIVTWLVGISVTRWVMREKGHDLCDYSFWAWIFWPVALFCALVKPARKEEAFDDAAFKVAASLMPAPVPPPTPMITAPTCEPVHKNSAAHRFIAAAERLAKAESEI
jgi:hypothetical protein